MMKSSNESLLRRFEAVLPWDILISVTVYEAGNRGHLVKHDANYLELDSGGTPLNLWQCTKLVTAGILLNTIFELSEFETLRNASETVSIHKAGDRGHLVKHDANHLELDSGGIPLKRWRCTKLVTIDILLNIRFFHASNRFLNPSGMTLALIRASESTW